MVIVGGVSAASDYPEGSLKRHPDYPEASDVFAVRTPFNDSEDGTGVTAWLRITPGTGVAYVTHDKVESWPDAELVDLEVP